MFGNDSIFGEKEEADIPGYSIIFLLLYDFQSPRARSSTMTYQVSVYKVGRTRLYIRRFALSFEDRRKVSTW